MNVVKWRRDLHKIAELSLCEFETTKYLILELKKMGYAPFSLLETGCFVFIDNDCSESICFRCDIDGIKLQEENECSYKSENDGVMHACGHDGHMASMLLFALMLKESTELFKYNILLLFQPAEEEFCGANLVIKTGIFNRYKVKYIFGFHLMPGIEFGKVFCKSDELMAGSCSFDCLVSGNSAHVGVYNEGIDSIYISSMLINLYQGIVSRMTSCLNKSIVHIGNIKGGTACNIVADKCLFNGTIRSFNKSNLEYIMNKMLDINKGIDLIYGSNTSIVINDKYLPLVNDKYLFEKFRHLFNSLNKPIFMAEDFSFYLEEVPGLFFFLGLGDASGLHTSNFEIDESVLSKGAEIFYKIATSL